MEENLKKLKDEQTKCGATVAQYEEAIPGQKETVADNEKKMEEMKSSLEEIEA